MTSPVYYVPAAFIYLVNIGLCIASMLTKSKKKDPAIHVVFPIFSFFGLIYFVSINAFGLPTESVIKNNFGSQEFFDQAVASGLVTSYKNTLDDFSMLFLLLFFFYIVLCFIKRARFIVGLEDEKNIVVQTTHPQNESHGADELKKYKELLDTGVITQEEFDAKKKQLLGL